MPTQPPSELALLRFQVVSAYLAFDPPRGQRHALRQQLAAKHWSLPDGRPFAFAPETLRGWVRAYLRDGLEGLEDAARVDIGVRVLTPDQVELLSDLKRQVPARSVDRIIEIAETLDKVPVGILKRSTVHRLLHAQGLSARPNGKTSTQDLDRFEAAFPNDLWQSDMRTGPMLPDPTQAGQRRQTWLSLFMDDHSRAILGAVWSFKSDRLPLMRAFREALRRYGRPGRLYYDNGGPYVSDHMKQVVAIVSKGADKPIYTTPRRPEGHGKIEALNRLILASFVEEVKASSLSTVDELNVAFRGWVDRYQRTVHSETGEAPLARWRRGADRVQSIDEDVLHEAFRFRIERTTDKTGVFSLFGQRYQVGAALARKKVVVHYDPDDLAQVDVWSGKRFQERVRPLCPGPHRRPVPRPEPEAEAEATDGKPSNPWVDHLLASGRPTEAEPDPVEALLADHTRMNEHVALLIEDHVLPEVFDRAKVMDFLERYGPLDPGAVEECLALALAFGGPDQHLDPLLADLLSALEVM